MYIVMFVKQCKILLFFVGIKIKADFFVLERGCTSTCIFRRARHNAL